MTDLSCSYLGLELRNPVLVSSCGYTGNIQNLKKIEELGAGAVVLQSVYEEQISLEHGNTKDLTRIPNDFLEYIGNYSKHCNTADYLKLIEGAKKNIKIPVLQVLIA